MRLTPSRLAIQAAIMALCAIGATSGHATEVVVTVPDFIGDPTLPSHELAGTFNFGSLAGVTAVTISGFWGNNVGPSYGSADATLYANQFAVATCSIGDYCWFNGTAPVAWSYSFTASQFATFVPSGKLSLYADADICCQNVLSGMKLTLSVAAVPEPETYALMLAGGGVVAWLARRRRMPRGHAA